MRSLAGTAILVACIMWATIHVMTNTQIELAKIAMEDYEESNFLAEPYMAALAKMKYEVNGEKYEIYELMANAASAGSSKFNFGGERIDLNEIIDPIHKEFQNAFGASNYYLFIEDEEGTTFFISPQLKKGESLGEIEVLTQLPLPLRDKEVSRAMLVKISEETGEEE